MTKEELQHWKPQIAEYEKEQLRLSRVRWRSEPFVLLKNSRERKYKP